MSTRRIPLAAAALLLSLVAAPAHAGGPLSVCAGTPTKYSGAGTVALNYDLGTLGPKSKAQADAMTTSAVSLWTNVATSTVTLARGADLPADVTSANYPTYIGGGTYQDGLNPVVYDSDGTIIDALFGSGARDWVGGFAGSAWFIYPTYCQYAEGRAVISGYLLDHAPGPLSDTTLMVILAHEIGHLIGLDHSQLDNDQGLAGANYPLMYPIAYRQSVSLHDDDAAAVSALYPDPSLGATYGQLTGNFTQVDGTPIRGANIWARENTTAKVYSVVSDYLMQNTGYFKLLLPAGTYTLHAEAIQTNFNSGSSVGPYSETYPPDLGAPVPSYSFMAPLYVNDAPMAPLTLGNGAPVQIGITAGCVATATFRFDGSGSVGGNCAVAPPGAPAIVSITPGDGAATITFSAPGSDGGSPITGYSATCVAAGQPSRSASGGASPLTVNGLVNGVAYSCSVSAANGAGTGAASAPAQVIPLGRPGAPTLNSVVVGRGSATLYFNVPASNGGSAITGYQAVCNALGKTSRTAIGSNSPLTVRTLSAGVAYTCSVNAINEFGDSEPSAALVAIPLAPANLTPILLMLFD